MAGIRSSCCIPRSLQFDSCPSFAYGWRTRLDSKARRRLRLRCRSRNRQPYRTFEPARVGLIRDSSVIIDAERSRETVEKRIERIVSTTNDQEAALCPIGPTELLRDLHRAPAPERRLRRERFLNEILADLTVHPYTRETALRAGKIDGEQQTRGVVIPFADLLVGATALALKFSVLTVNVRHFERIPDLQIVKI